MELLALDSFREARRWKKSVVSVEKTCLHNSIHED